MTKTQQIKSNIDHHTCAIPSNYRVDQHGMASLAHVTIPSASRPCTPLLQGNDFSYPVHCAVPVSIIDDMVQSMP